jgi:hypothetical protein
MGADSTQLHVVPPLGAVGRTPADGDDVGDLGLTVVIFVTALVPLVCELAGIGHWGDGSLGLGTVGVLFAGRELWAAWVDGMTRSSARSSGRPEPLV